MITEEVFRKQLLDLVKMAKNQGMCVTREQIEDAFRDMDLNEERLKLIYEYLEHSKITVGEEADLDTLLTGDERNYLEQYLEELKDLPEYSKEQKEEIYTRIYRSSNNELKEKVLHFMLPKVVEIARLYSGQGVLLEDLIGEGNVALTMGIEMVSLADDPNDIEGFLAKNVMEAMESYIVEESGERKQDDDVLNQINKITSAAKELAEELCRAVTIEELVKETKLSEDDIKRMILLAGNNLDYIEKLNEE